MNKRSLIVLSLCLVIGAGFAVYVWASGCCGGEPGPPCVCNGECFQVVDTCLFDFDVDHSRDCGIGHDVYLYIKAQGGEEYTAFLMTLQTPGPPFPLCMQYGVELELEPNTVYYYYFGCADCEEECCDDHFNTEDCGS